jgi:predicted transcriptional regulator
MDVLKIMTDKQIRRLVVTKEGKAVGIVTERRILGTLIQKRE